MLTIVGLGPGDGRYLTREAWDVLRQAPLIYVRTMRHPAVNDLPAKEAIHSFDDLYERAEAFDDVYEQIVNTLLDKAAAGGEVIYAVPGHPFVGEATVTRLIAAAEGAGIPTRVVAGLSYIEPCLTAVGQDGMEGVQLLDAIDIARQDYPQLSPDRPVLIGQVYNRLLAGEVKLSLTGIYPDDHEVALVHAAGTSEEVVERIPLYEIDHSEKIAHLTSLFIPPLPEASDLAALAAAVATLRGPEGCPWDQQQTPLSLREGFLEEAYEVLDALDAGDVDGLREELGDILLHVAMQSQIAAEDGLFTLSDVIAGIVAKIIRRHPHVWGAVEAGDSQQVVANWEAIKAEEKSRKGEDGQAAAPSMLDDVARALPALVYSQKIQKKVARAGFDWQNIGGVYDKLSEELAELQAAHTPAEQQSEIGDILFTVVNVARWLDIDPEIALRDANTKFARRFRVVEALARERAFVLPEQDEPTLIALWDEAKRQLASDPGRSIQ